MDEATAALAESAADADRLRTERGMFERATRDLSMLNAKLAQKLVDREGASAYARHGAVAATGMDPSHWTTNASSAQPSQSTTAATIRGVPEESLHGTSDVGGRGGAVGASAHTASSTHLEDGRGDLGSMSRKKPAKPKSSTLNHKT